MAALRSDRDEHRQWEAEQEAQRRKEREERIHREFERRLNPRSKEDFEVLYHALESECWGPVWAAGSSYYMGRWTLWCGWASAMAPPPTGAVWRQDEMKRINACTSGPERKAALCGLLEQEAQLIASIGRHRITANQENKVEETHRLLDAVRQRVGCWGWSVRSGPVVADMDSP